MDRFGIVTNDEKDTDLATTKQICKYLQERGRKCLLAGDYKEDKETFVKNIDGLIVLGGDGTLLQAAREYVDSGVPLLGINLGTLGYLTSVEKDELWTCMDALLKDEYTIEHRMMLRGTVYHQGRRIMEEQAVNDVIVSRSGFSKLVELKLYVNDELLDIYVADGVIVSTPTGSTGYNLAAGGPVVYPETELMVITPICPHSLTARSIVVSGREKITIEIGRRRKDQLEEALITYDGQPGKELETSDRIEVGEAKGAVRLIKINNRSFYQVLRSKIGNVSNHS